MTGLRAATGVGSLPGTDVREAGALVLGELPELPHLPELPARGPHAGMVARSAALLPELHVDLQPAGWRLVPRAGIDERRAATTLRDDVDIFGERATDYTGPLKAQLCGPVTLATAVDLARGGRAVADPGAVRDLGQAFAEGAVAHLARLRAAVPGAELVLQVDEPGLPAALAGAIPRESGWGRHRPLDPPAVESLLAEVAAAVREAGAVPVVHCCAADVPVALLRRAGFAAVSLDATLLDAAADEPLAEAVEAGTSIWWGAVPTVAGDVSSVAAATVVRRAWSRLGFGAERLAEGVVVTPTCGLAGASPARARQAMTAARDAVRRLADPEREGER